MRVLKIDSQLVDIDETTSIGIDLQIYDVKEPSKRKVNVSNNFTIPKTNRNLLIIGAISIPQSTSTSIYSVKSCDYWNDDIQLIKSAAVRVESISDRINLYVASKLDIWDTLKNIKWTDFVTSFIQYLGVYKDYPISTSAPERTLQAFIDIFTRTADGLLIPMYYGTFRVDAALENKHNICLGTPSVTPEDYPNGVNNGGHVCAYVKTIFEWISHNYGVNFLIGESVNGNIWNDDIASRIYLPIRDIYVEKFGDRYYFTNSALSGTPSYFGPLWDVKDKPDKTLWDFVNTFFQKFNIIKEVITFEGEEAILLARFDAIKTQAPIIDFGDIVSIASFKPSIEGYSQHNYIKYKSVHENGDPLFGQRDLICNNKNLDSSTELFEIDEYIPVFRPIDGGVIPDLSAAESFKTFTFFVSDGLTDDTITIKYDIYSSYTAVKQLHKPALYSLDSEYTLLGEMVSYPKFYQIKKWLSLKDVYELKFFAQYFIKELNGSYFLNKISGFNPDKSKEPTTIDVIYVSDKTPYPLVQPPYIPNIDDYYVDGFNDPFVDGEGNYFY